jgi:hypothetical protein
LGGRDSSSRSLPQQCGAVEVAGAGRSLEVDETVQLRGVVLTGFRRSSCGPGSPRPRFLVIWKSDCREKLGTLALDDRDDAGWPDAAAEGGAGTGGRTTMDSFESEEGMASRSGGGRGRERGWDDAGEERGRVVLVLAFGPRSPAIERPWQLAVGKKMDRIPKEMNRCCRE